MLHIESRDYSSYKYVDESKPDLDLSGSVYPCPIKNHLLHGDTIHEKCSPYRSANIPGVLVLSKTYGSTKAGKLYYKFIPDKHFLPEFLVPYELKASFSKAHKNKFAIIRFKEWTQEHPVGILVETIGNVDKLEAFCEYQLHRRGLQVSMAAFNAHVKTALADEHKCIATIQQRHQLHTVGEGETIFSIDPETSLDYDDAFSVLMTGANTYRVTVYIANVYLWLATFDLFKYMTDRVSTIYLPDKKRPMLPLLLSDNYCSLKAGTKRVVNTYSQEFDINTRQPIGEPRFGQGIATIAKNWAYDDRGLVEDAGYDILKRLSEKEDSHDVVAYWMIKMNVECANKGTRIYRGTCCLGDDECLSAKYCLEPLEHRALNQPKYTHITSPIRRLVDIMNQGLVLDMSMDYINEQCRQIKRAQMDCDLLAFSMKTEPETEYEGTIVDVLTFGPLIANEYTVQFTNSLRVRYKSASAYEIGSTHMFKILVFNDEHTLCKKVRICIRFPL